MNTVYYSIVFILQNDPVLLYNWGTEHHHATQDLNLYPGTTMEHNHFETHHMYNKARLLLLLPHFPPLHFLCNKEVE